MQSQHARACAAYAEVYLILGTYYSITRPLTDAAITRVMVSRSAQGSDQCLVPGRQPLQVQLNYLERPEDEKSGNAKTILKPDMLSLHAAVTNPYNTLETACKLELEHVHLDL